MERGKFISFEGIDGCGKTTQIIRLEEYLRKKGIKVIKTREPGGTALGGVLRRVLKYSQETYSLLNEKYSDNKDFVLLPLDQVRTLEAEMYLFFAARAEFVSHIIEPNINAGISVISDRFADSTRAYQGGGGFGSEPKVIKHINRIHEFILRGYWPDKTFFMDISYEVSRHRLSLEHSTDDDFEKRKKNFFEGIIAEYHNIAKENPGRVVVIDGTRSIDDIFDNCVLPVVKSLYNF